MNGTFIQNILVVLKQKNICFSEQIVYSKESLAAPDKRQFNFLRTEVYQGYKNHDLTHKAVEG